jgi:hypothetical protein
VRSSRHSTLPSSRNAFRRSFLSRINERDEPFMAGEADVAGPWHVEELPGGLFGLYRLGESHAGGFQPAAVFRDRSLALLSAAVLPGTGREAAFRLQKEAGPEGFLVETGNHGDGAGPVGHLALFDESLIDALHVVESLTRSPEALANLLEAAGPLALEHAGVILEERFPE